MCASQSNLIALEDGNSVWASPVPTLGLPLEALEIGWSRTNKFANSIDTCAECWTNTAQFRLARFGKFRIRWNSDARGSHRIACLIVGSRVNDCFIRMKVVICTPTGSCGCSKCKRLRLECPQGKDPTTLSG